MRQVFFLFLLLLSFTHIQAQPITSVGIDSLVERTLKAFDVPGIAVAVVKDGKLVHSKGYGVRSLKTGKPVDENTMFCIASNSKAFTAAALAILVDEGKIKWDDKVREYIPEFMMYDPYVTEAFTIRDLLTHRSGLGLGAGDLMMFPDSSNFTVNDIIHNLRYLKPVSGFRSKYDYDNNLYVVAGEVVARVSGKSWGEFVEQRIFEPLGMSGSASSFAGLKNKTNVVDPHSKVNGTVQVIRRNQIPVAQAAGGIYSNISELSKWVTLQLAHGKLGNGKRLFSETVHEEMWTPQTIVPAGAPGRYNTHFAAYGLGFFINDVKGYKQLSHTGGIDGMVTQITMLPELGLGIIVLTNQEEGSAFRAITNQIKDSYLGLNGTDHVAELAAKRRDALKKATGITDSIWRMVDAASKTTQPDFNQVAGTYEDPWFGEVTIKMKNGKPWFESARSPFISGELLYLKGNTYVARWTKRNMDADAYVNFVLDEAGKAKGMTMHAISPLTDFSYDFHDLDFKRKEIKSEEPQRKI
ncbi:serine hydrolase [Polluticoccus soli]|uniref:serine hydrolase n=1 Tax=Polluticoccus soli TaxID=3034150 RepID=UPI0023E306E8|nr:serine hydrolase [Flavipsychrobacter sp. JY13-12]